MQRDRVQDQYPWTWEIPLAILCGVLVVGVGVPVTAGVGVGEGVGVTVGVGEAVTAWKRATRTSRLSTPPLSCFLTYWLPA